MKWSLQQLQKYNGKLIEFKSTYDFSEEIKNIADILGISIAEVEGVGQCLYLDKFQFKLKISCILILQDARTLDPVDFPVKLNVIETFDVDATGDDDTRLIEKNTIDLRPVVWENILLEKPIRCVKDESPN